eukprot:scaffold536_cov250-Pinguiococcus_pyrenoidosus.AAC.16
MAFAPREAKTSIHARALNFTSAVSLQDCHATNEERQIRLRPVRQRGHPDHAGHDQREDQQRAADPEPSHDDGRPQQAHGKAHEVGKLSEPRHEGRHQVRTALDAGGGARLMSAHGFELEVQDGQHDLADAGHDEQTQHVGIQEHLRATDVKYGRLEALAMDYVRGAVRTRRRPRPTPDGRLSPPLQIRLFVAPAREGKWALLTLRSLRSRPTREMRGADEEDAVAVQHARIGRNGRARDRAQLRDGNDDPVATLRRLQVHRVIGERPEKRHRHRAKGLDGAVANPAKQPPRGVRRGRRRAISRQRQESR